MAAVEPRAEPKNYRLLYKLGSGTYATVYKGQKKVLVNRPVRTHNSITGQPCRESAVHVVFNPNLALAGLYEE